MKKGFTILELLVASLLLGILMTILTMIFNQSSIAWRIGTGSIVDLDEARIAVAKIRTEADNAYLWEGAGNGGMVSVLSVWSESGGSGVSKLRQNRSVSAPGISCTPAEQISHLSGSVTATDVAKSGTASSDWSASLSASSGTASGGHNYTVNVRSNGPNGKENDYDDIWSFPDDFDL